MARPGTGQFKRRELAHRVSHGIEVILLWGPTNDEVVVKVVEHGSDTSFEMAVPGTRALDAFHHPYAYAARRGVEYEPELSGAT